MQAGKRRSISRWLTGFVGAALVLPLLYLAWLAASAAEHQAPITYRHSFELNFDGLANGEYPDGSPFVLSRILSDEVLSRVLEQDEFEALDISTSALRDAIYIEPYVADLPSIRDRYVGGIADAGLSASDLADREQDLRRQTDLQRSGTIRLTLKWPGGDALNDDDAELLLRAVTATWAERAIVEQGVLEVNRAVYSERIFEPERYEALDYPIAIDLLTDNIALLLEDIAALQDLPGGEDVRDPETGLRLIDVDRRLRDVTRYDLRSLADPVTELGLTKDSDAASLYLRSELEEVRLQQDFWLQRAQQTRELLSGARGPDSRTRSPESSPNEPSASRGQLDDSFLNRLLELAAQGDNQAFRQELTQQVMEFEETALSLDRRIQDLERSLSAVQEGTDASIVAEQYREQVESALPEVLSALREQTRRINRLSKAISTRAAGGATSLITPIDDSFESSERPLLPPGSLQKAGSLSLLGLIGLLGVGAIVSARRRQH